MMHINSGSNEERLDMSKTRVNVRCICRNTHIILN